MKKPLLSIVNTLVFLLLSLFVSYGTSPLWTRVLDYNEHNKSTSIGSVLLGESRILPSGYIGHGSYAAPAFVINSLVTWDLDGNFLSHTPSLFNPTRKADAKGQSFANYNPANLSKSIDDYPGGNFELLYANDLYLYAVGYLHESYTGSENFLTISKLDSQGQILFQRHHYWENIEDFANEMAPNTMDVHNDDKMLIGLGSHTIIKADAEGQLVWEKEPEFPVHQVGFLDDEKFFILSSGSLVIADMEGNIQDAFDFEGDCLQGLAAVESIFLVFAHELIVLDYDLEILTTLPAPEGIALQSIKSFHDQLWLMGQQEQQIQLLQIENLEFSGPLGFDLMVESPDFLVAGSKVIFTGTSYSEQMAVYAYDMEQETDPYIWPDIHVLDFAISNISYVYEDKNANGQPAIAFEFDSEITLYNAGEEVIESFAVFTHLMSLGVGQLNPSFYERFSGLALHPQEEITLSMPRLTRYDPPSLHTQFCFEVLAPNAKIEPDISHNTLCKNINTTLSSDQVHNHSYSVYPNPVRDLLQIQLPLEGYNHVEIKDLNGRLVYEAFGTGPHIIVDTSVLPSGVYILSLKGDGVQFTHKIIKK